MATLNDTSYTLITQWTQHPSGLGGSYFERVYGIIIAQDAETLTTTVKFQWRVGILYNSSGGVYNNYSYTRKFSATNATPTFSSSFSFGGKYYTSDVETVRKTFTMTFQHNSDGTYSDSCVMKVPNWSGTTQTVNGTIELPTIPVTTISTDDFYMDGSSALTVGLTQQSANYYSVVKYQYPDLTATDVEIGRGGGSASLSFSTVPTDLSSSVPTDTDYTDCLITVDTYEDSSYSTLVCTVYATIKAYVNSSWVPTATISSVTESNLTISSLYPSLSGFVAGYSLPEVEIDFTGSNGSTPVSYQINYSDGTGSTVLSSTNTTETLDFTVTPTTNVTGIYAYVTDSRGRTSSVAAYTTTIYSYTVPTISNVQAVRGFMNGSTFEEDITGDYIQFSCKWAISAINNLNSATITVNDGSSDVVSYTVSSYSQTTQTVIGVAGTYANTSAHTFTVTITDDLNASSLTITVSKSTLPLSLYDDGTNVAVVVGRVAQSSGAGKFTTDLPFYPPMTTVTSGNWTFYEWQIGDLKFLIGKKSSASYAITSTSGNIYYCNAGTCTFPSGYFSSAIYYHSAQLQTTSGNNAWAWTRNVTTTSIDAIFLGRGASATQSGSLVIFAVGV